MGRLPHALNAPLTGTLAGQIVALCLDDGIDGAPRMVLRPRDEIVRPVTTGNGTTPATGWNESEKTNPMVGTIDIDLSGIEENKPPSRRNSGRCSFDDRRGVGFE